MKNCPVCQAVLDDQATFCQACGTSLAAAPAPQAPPQTPPQTPPQAPPQQSYQQAYQQPMYAPVPMPDPFDHTAEFEAEDISESKPFCMLVYLLSVIGIIIALLARPDSKYTAFHVRQAIKFTVVEMLLILASAVLGFTVIVPIAGGICLVIITVLKIISFFQISAGKAKEPAIICKLGFLK
ncbi:MAG TPA: zinc ribbon domain-containing protein [Bacillota bacterium]|nr:zinc ribbon domain-containing protein [Bacillota bacterium]